MTKEKQGVEELKEKIEELKKRINELESENLIASAILNLAPIAIIVYTNGEIVYANEASLRMVKAKKIDDLVGKDVREFVLKEDIEKVIERMKEIEKNKKPFTNIKERYLDLEGGVLEVETSAIPIRFNSKDSVLILMRDLTEEERYRKKLEDREAKYKILTENSLVGVYVLQDEKIIFCNNKYAEIVGEKTYKDVIGRSVYDFVHPDDIDRVREEIKKRESGKEKFSHYEIRHIRNNEIRYHEVFGSVINIGGKPAVGGVLIDVTERKLMEKKIEESEQTYRGILDSIEEAIYIQDKNGIFLDVNYGAVKMYGYEKEELIGMNPESVSAPGLNDMKEVFRKFMLTLKKGIPQEFEFWGKKKDGTFFPKNVRLYKGTYFGEDVVIAVAQDITEKKKMEEEKKFMNIRIQKSQKLRTLGTLAGGIAHDFNNILTPILGYANMIKKVNRDKRIDKYVSLIIESSQRAKELIKRILSYSKDVPMEKKIIKLEEEIERILSLLRESIPVTIRIRKKLSKGCSPVYAAPVHIQQILMNLCTNAFKAMEDKGGIIEIELTEISKKNLPEQLKYLEGEKFAMIKVKDNGIGMSKETLEKIFEPFYTTKEHGTGLGMFIVSTIVEGYGGDIIIESEEGKGTEVKVFLPVATKELIEKVKREEYEKTIDKKELSNHKKRKKDKIKVLIVDDEKMITELIQEVLSSEGFKVKVFNDSRKALKSVRKNRETFDLIITDLTMPQMTGLEFSKEVKKINPNIPIILLTGYNKELDEKSRTEFNIKKILMKPINIENLLKEIKEVLF